MSIGVAVAVFVGALVATYLSCMRPMDRRVRPIPAAVRRSAAGTDRRKRQPTPGRLG